VTQRLVNRIELVATPALTPALSPRRGGALRRVSSIRGPLVHRSFSPANRQPAATGNSTSEFSKRVRLLAPLPGEEGQGEGERHTNFIPARNQSKGMFGKGIKTELEKIYSAIPLPYIPLPSPLCAFALIPMSLLTPELLRRLEQFQLLAARRTCLPPSAKRMNMNSRGCQPTDSHRKTDPTLKGSHHQSPHRAFRIRRVHCQTHARWFSPFRAAIFLTAVPWVAPTAIHVVRLRRTGRSHSRGICRSAYNSASPRHDCDATNS